MLVLGQPSERTRKKEENFFFFLCSICPLKMRTRMDLLFFLWLGGGERYNSFTNYGIMGKSRGVYRTCGNAHVICFLRKKTLMHMRNLLRHVVKWWAYFEKKYWMIIFERSEKMCVIKSRLPASLAKQLKKKKIWSIAVSRNNQ